MTDKLRELANQAYCDYTEQLKRPVCLGVYAKLKDGTFGKAELEAHVRAGELLGRHRAFAEAALAASQPSDMQSKLEALREAISDAIGYIAAREFHVSRGQISGSTRWELEQVRERLTAILEGK